ncbi:hypothetical protein JCM8097_003282 [Rhodosporidiobolus ruineniae]
MSSSSSAAASGSASSVATSAVSTATPAIAGTQSYNVSSDSSQLTYYGAVAWRSDTTPGYYEAYSNNSDAAVTFSFTGVSVSYLAHRKADRGICLLTLDGVKPYTIDLYNDSGYDQGLEVIWSSGTLVYGRHNVTISQQVAPDGRIGYYPYLVTELWTEVVPTDVGAYTATQYVPSSSASPSPSNSSSSTDTAAIAGGTVGAVVACLLLGFLVYLWRRDKARRRRSEGGFGAPVQKVKRAEGKMAIEDEAEGSSGSGSGASGGAGGDHVGMGAYGAVPGGMGAAAAGAGAYGWPGAPYDPYAAYGYPAASLPPPPSMPGSVDPSAYSSSYASPWGAPIPAPYPPHPHSASSSADAYSVHHHHPSYPVSSSADTSPSSPAFSRSQPAPPTAAGGGPFADPYGHRYSFGGGSEGTVGTGGGGGGGGGGGSYYPYHSEGRGSETRSYAVPEL